MSTTNAADPHCTAPTGAKDQDLLDREAWDRTAADRAALAAEGLPPFNLDAYFAAGRALFAAEAIGPFRPVLAQLPAYDLRCVDALERNGRALRHVQTELLRRVQKISENPALAREGYALRALLLAQCELLALKGTVPAALLAAVREGSGYRDLVADLNVLVGLLRTSPPTVIGEHTPVTPADLGRAASVAHELGLHLGLDPTTDLTQAQLLEERSKLAALLVRAHAEARRGMGYVRYHEGDVARFVPSLHVAGGATRRADPAADPSLAALHEQLHAEDPVADPADHPFAE